ncbi:MAG: diaminopimelate epimerase [Halolamina sp.]
MTVPFEKYDGAGNDFVVVDAAEWQTAASQGVARAGDVDAAGSVEDRAAFARLHCDRSTGVTDEASDRQGADGVLFLALDTDPDPATVTMTHLQPDGSIAEMCGNGVRCVAAWAADRAETSMFDIDTPAGTRRAVVDGEEVAVEMGEPTFDPEAVPLASDEPLVDAPLDELDDTPAAGRSITAVNTGVPHAVVFVDDVDAIDIDAVAPPIRHAEAFPEGANVTFASTVSADGPGTVDPDGSGFRQRTYERGVEGETRACGTGAVAIVAAATRLGRLGQGDERWVAVRPPGGELAVTVSDDGPARLRGPAKKRFEGELPLPADRQVADRQGDEQ